MLLGPLISMTGSKKMGNLLAKAAPTTLPCEAASEAE
jgi:hypothetical protein